MKRNFRMTAACLLFALSAIPIAKPQGMAQALAQGGTEGPDGFQLYSVSVYGEYSSTTVPFGSNVAFGSSLPTGTSNLGPNYLAGILAKVGYRKTGARTNFYVTYVPSYDASFRYSSLNSMNNFVSFGVIHDLGPRWTLTSSGTAFTARWDQFLFSPTVFSGLAGTPSTFDELSQAILSGTYTSSQLASILTGAPLIESPATSLIYGPRIFDASLRNEISYFQSARLRFHFGFGATRIQRLNSGQVETASVSLLPETTTAIVTAGVTYALSPLTALDFEGTANRTFSRLEDAYISTGTAKISRIFGRHWIAQGRGGGGLVTPVRETFANIAGRRYLAGSTITYKTLSHTFMGSYDRTITDLYGLGAASVGIASGAWNWHIPGHTWSAFAIGRYEAMQNIGSHNLDASLGDAGIERHFGTHTSVQLAYIYGRISGVFVSVPENVMPEKQALQGARLVVSWSPHMPFDM
jgi:hypothetical protein